MLCVTGAKQTDAVTNNKTTAYAGGEERESFPSLLL